MTLSNGQRNAAFLSSVDAETKQSILENIAAHYGSSVEEALSEVCDQEAESLLDYVTGSTRLAVSVLMQKHWLLRGRA